MSQAGILDVENSHPQIPTLFIEDVGSAVPIANVLYVLGTGGISTSGAANIITIDGSGLVSAIEFVVDASTAPGTNPVVPDGADQVTITGGQVASGTVGTNVIRTDSLAASSFTIEIQRTAVSALPDLTLNGVCHFDSDAFDVDADGFVQLNAGFIGITKINVDASTPPGTDPVVADSMGAITITGGQVATGTIGTNVIRTDSLNANEFTIEIQRTTAVAATDVTKNGVSHFDSTQFSVDSNAFVQISGGGFEWLDVSGAFSPLKNKGYFITATATGTLPASPSQGDTIKFFVDHASQVLTIQAAGTQIIRLGSLVSSATGTATSTQQGDSLELVYRSSDDCWCSVCGFSGIWIMA